MDERTNELQAARQAVAVECPNGETEFTYANQTCMDCGLPECFLPLSQRINPGPTPGHNLAIRRILMPRDTNPRGEIFGGAILAEMDLAGAVEARQHTEHDVATRFMNGVEFMHPVAVGDVVTFYTDLVKIGTTSITVKVEVEFSRDGKTSPVAALATEIVYVAVAHNEDGTITKVPVK